MRVKSFSRQGIRLVAAVGVACCALLLAAIATTHADSGPLMLQSTTCDDGMVGVPYTCVLPIAGGTIPYTVTAKGLPPGLDIQMWSSAITGRPMSVGSFSPVVTVKDDSNPPMSKEFTVTIKVSAKAAPSDGK